jgi:Tfp pilus assembly protein PilF
MVLRLIWIITLVFFMAGCSGVLLKPAEKPVVATTKAEKQLLQQGQQYYMQGKFEPALKKAQDTLKLNPDNVERWKNSITACNSASGQRHTSPTIYLISIY